MAVARSRVFLVGTPHQPGCNMRRSRRSAAGGLRPFLITELIRDFFVPFDDLVATDFMEIFHCSRFKLDPVPIGIKHWVFESCMNRFSSMLR